MVAEGLIWIQTTGGSDAQGLCTQLSLYFFTGVYGWAGWVLPPGEGMGAEWSQAAASAVSVAMTAELPLFLSGFLPLPTEVPND